jgi:hypothetical protein
MTARQRDFFHPRYNAYVPACRYADDVVHSAPLVVNFGAPAAANATAILNAQSIATAGGVNVSFTMSEIWGRNVTVVASAAATSTVTVIGRDYLGQPMRETLTLNGTTPVVGLKSFKWIFRVEYGATAGVTINVGTGSRLGLPYRVSNVLAEKVNSVAGTVGTLTAAVLTDPQTATTGDPRGQYTPNATMNGTNRIEIAVLTDNFVNASGNGGLFGIAHFGG